MSGIVSATREHATPVGQLLHDIERGGPIASNGASLLKDLLGSKLSDLKTMQAIASSHMQADMSGKPVDDRELLLEKTIQWLSKAPSDSLLAKKAGGALVGLLYDDLDHAPRTLLGDKLRFRQPDGSHNNPWQPDVGKAGMPYARNVGPMQSVPLHSLPSPEEVFDVAMKRDDGVFKEHPAGLSGLFTSFATTVQHNLFRTQRRGDPNINECSGYLDLSIIYGNDAATVEQVRTHVDGQILPDVVAEDRLWGMPPSVIALCVLFSRNHNHIASQLLRINERGNFRPWEELNEEERKKQDEELFGTARLVNCAHYMSVILGDYLRSILGLTATESTWRLDPRTPDAKRETGAGNHTSVEFNLLYRWHSLLTASDEEFCDRWMREYLPEDRKNAPVDELTRADMGAVFARAREALGKDVANYEHLELKRQPDGRFKDEDLVAVFMAAHESPAHAFGANTTPAVLKAAEVMGMVFARQVWRTCTLNEFRRHLKLKPIESFAEFNSDPKVASAFERWYGHPDRIELYSGLMCEETKVAMVGAGLCPGFTVSRTILSDAVTIVRGDRFFNESLNADGLTSWGLESTLGKGDNGSYGGLLSDLFQTTLPNSFRYNSLVANFPLQTSKSMKKNLAGLGVLHKYDVERPSQLNDWRFVTGQEAVEEVLNSDAFSGPYQHELSSLLGSSSAPSKDRLRKVTEALFYTGTWQESSAKFFSEKVGSLLSEAAYDVGNGVMSVEIIRDVINRVWVLYYADLFGITLKSKTDASGLMTVDELALLLGSFFQYLAVDFQAAKSFHLKESAIKTVKLLREIIEARMNEMTLVGGLLSTVESLRKTVTGTSSSRLGSMSTSATRFYARLAKLQRMHGYTSEELVTVLLETLVGGTIPAQDALAQLVAFYVQPAQGPHLQHLTQLSKESSSSRVNSELLGFYYEALRLTPAWQGAARFCTKPTSIEVDGELVQMDVGDRVYVDLKQLVQGGSPNKRSGDELQPARPRFQHGLVEKALYASPLGLLNTHTSFVVMREIFRLNVFQAPGPAGQLQSFPEPLGKSGASVHYFLDKNALPTPFPAQMTLRYDSGGWIPSVKAS